MTAEQLLLPRFEVIADFPKSSYNIGRIITPIKEGSSYFYSLEAPSSELIGFPEKYPHLFKKLNWWEHRKKEDMPKRLICKAIKDDTEIMEILDWDMELLFGWTDIENRKGCGLRSFNPEYGYFPVD